MFTRIRDFIGSLFDDDKRAFFRALRHGHADPVIKYLEPKDNRTPIIDVNVTHEGLTPLMVAAIYGHFEITLFLIDKGANIHARDQKGATALCLATQHGHKDIAHILLEKGASVELAYATENGCSLTLKEFAEHKQHLHIAKLIQAKINPTHEDRLESICFFGIIPNDYVCPVSHETMDDPITVSSGITYERNALRKIIIDNQTKTFICPMTRQAIDEAELNFKANVIVQKRIERFVLRQEGHDQPVDGENNFLFCPITNEPIDDPVTAANGLTYDRQSLVEAFKSARDPEMLICPKSGFPIEKAAIRYKTCRLVKNIIDENKVAQDKAYVHLQGLFKQEQASSPSPTSTMPTKNGQLSNEFN